MDERTVDRAISELARLLDYDSPSQTNLRKAMCVNKEGEYSDANYSNNSLATVGDSVLKLILSDYLYSKGQSRGEITECKSSVESNDNLRRLTKGLDLYRFAYNDSFFFYDAPEGAQLPGGKHDVYLEAIIGAAFYDMGFERCRRWVREKLFPLLFDLRKYSE